jgi:hypothetical protein
MSSHGVVTAPSINVLGAFFPDWMVCILGAIVLTVLVHQALLAIGLIQRPGRLAWLLVYPALGCIFAMASWPAFFQN